MLATIDKQTDEKRLGEDTKDLIKSHLAEHQDALREMQERLRMSSEDMEMNRVRRQELEVLLEKREGAYEDLLGKLIFPSPGRGRADENRQDRQFAERRHCRD